MSARLVLLRHTAPAIEPGICYGRLDLDLAEPGAEAEIAAALDALPFQPVRIVTSPALRCRRLAEAAAARFACPLAEEPRLWEMDFGSWEGRQWADIPRAELDAWAADFMQASPHGGETVAAMKARVRGALQALTAAPVPTLAVTHAGVLKTVAALNGKEDPWRFSPPFGSWIEHAPA